jgi:hypothetical protein
MQIIHTLFGEIELAIMVEIKAPKPPMGDLKLTQFREKN